MCALSGREAAVSKQGSLESRTKTASLDEAPHSASLVAGGREMVSIRGEEDDPCVCWLPINRSISISQK
jgi:hypothetical protein